MSPNWRTWVTEMDLAALRWLRAILIGALVIFAGVMALIASGQRAAATRTRPEPFYCAVEAGPTVAKCPPEPGTKVIATYPGGLVATLTWQDGQWWQHLPGGKLIEAPMPHDWRLP